MRAVLFALVVCGGLGACGKKSTPEAAGPEVTSAPEPQPAAMTVKMPAGGEAKAFARNLIDTDIVDFKPTGTGSSVQFVYKTMSFMPDGTWSADASVEASFEEIPCKESGTWSIANVTSPQIGTVTWTVDKTNCAMREGGEETRGQVTLGKGTGFSVAFR